MNSFLASIKLNIKVTTFNVLRHLSEKRLQRNITKKLCKMATAVMLMIAQEQMISFLHIVTTFSQNNLVVISKNRDTYIVNKIINVTELLMFFFSNKKQ